MQTLWTIGHATHSIDGFLAVLHAHSIETVVDVRRFPGSRRHPQFGADALRASLSAHGIGYEWIAMLGGRRRADPSNVEGSAWRHPSFRAYAQHLQTGEFSEGLECLMHIGQATRTAVMCSELLWWRCHRRLIADVAVFCGWNVMHILDAQPSTVHQLSAPAQIGQVGLTYMALESPATPDCC